MTHEKEVNGQATDEATKFLVRLAEQSPRLGELMEEFFFRLSQFNRALQEPKRDAAKIKARWEVVLKVMNDLIDVMI